MGIKVYPQTAKGELERLNESLQSAADQVAPLKSGIEEYIGASDLDCIRNGNPAAPHPDSRRTAAGCHC